MATLVPKPKSLFFYHLSKNKKLLALIFLAIFLATGVIIGAVVIHKELKQIRRLRHDLSATQFAVSQYKRQVSQLSHDDDLRISKLQQAWTDIESKLRSQEEQIRKLGHILPQQSPHPDMREANILQELKAQQEMNIQAQQRIRSYELQLVALTHEMKDLKEQNQLIRQEQIRMIAEHLESLSQQPQADQEQEPLKKSLDLRISQLINADYELDQKLQDVQKAVESCAKIGELKALEVYYDDKLANLTHVIQKSANSQVKNSSNNEQFKQVQQDLIKLAQEEEGIKAAFNKLGENQKNNEERLKALENQDHLNVLSARPVDAPLYPQKALEEAVKKYNALSKSGQNKKELKEAKKQIKQLHRQMNQQPEEIIQNTLNQKKPEGNKVQIEEIFEQEPYETQFGNDLANIIHAFIDLYHDM